MSDVVLVKVNGIDVKTSDILVRLKANGEYRKALTSQIQFSSIKDFAAKNSIEVSDGELQAQVTVKRKELQLFTIDDTNKYLSNLGISIDQWAETLEEELLVEKVKSHVITDEVIESFYNQNKQQFVSLSLYKIVLKDKEAAEEIKLQTTADGVPFTALAQKFSDDKLTAQSGGFAGLKTRGTLNPAVETFIFASQEGEVLGPFQEDGTYTLYKVEKKNYPELNEALKAQIKNQLYENWKTSLMGAARIEVPKH